MSKPNLFVCDAESAPPCDPEGYWRSLASRLAECLGSRSDLSDTDRTILHDFSVADKDYGVPFTVLSLRYDDKICTGLIDAEDESIIKGYVWRTDASGYAIADIPDGKVYMHRLIMSAHGHSLEDKEIDHANCVKSDNRKKNLRVCERQQNAKNISKRKGCTSRYKGVSFLKDRNNYRCEVSSEGKVVFTGRFKTELEAAQKYNEIALKYHGQYAKLNQL